MEGERSSLELAFGRSRVLGASEPVTRIAVSDPRIADYLLVGSKQVYVYGKAIGQTHLLLWNGDRLLQQIDINVSVDLGELRRSLAELLPGETQIGVRNLGTSIVLTGTVADAIAADQAVGFVEAYARGLGNIAPGGAGAGGGTTGSGSTDSGASSGGATGGAAGRSLVRVINTLRIRDPQQVMLEVRIAEVSKSLIQRLGSSFNGTGTAGDFSGGVTSGFLTPGSPLATLLFRGRGIGVDAQKQQDVFRILAEPTIIAVSGEEGSFLAGGRLLIPVNQGAGGVAAVTLQERDFGVGLKFRPTVLDDSRISLRVAPEVTELGFQSLQVGGANSIQVGGANNLTTSPIPSFTLRRVSTTVQMRDGQSLIIAGLLKDNLRNAVKQVPLLGDVPILGALFRSSSYQADLTELIVVVTPRLVRATDERPELPTERYIPPTERQLFLEGRVDGTPPDETGQPGGEPAR
jgi:pilus assembly protein CpaC